MTNALVSLRPKCHELDKQVKTKKILNGKEVKKRSEREKNRKNIHAAIFKEAFVRKETSLLNGSAIG